MRASSATFSGLAESSRTFAPGVTFGGPSADEAATIYSAATVADTAAYLATLGVTATPIAGYNFDTDGADFGPSGYTLTAQNSATVVASAHGSAAQQVHSGAYWKVADAVPFEFGTSAFAFLARVRFTAAPAGNAHVFGRGSSASAHYALRMAVDGSLFVSGKQMGAPTTAALVDDVTDGFALWVALGRSVADQKIWIRVTGTGAESAFANTVDLTSGSAVFGLWDGGSTGSVDCEVDHLLVFSGADAETIYTSRVALVTALEAAE